MDIDWRKQEQAYTAARQKADVPYPISNKGNPLRALVNPNEGMFDRNMRTLRRDLQMREQPHTGQVYAGIMDNMRYGGNE